MDFQDKIVNFGRLEKVAKKSGGLYFIRPQANNHKKDF
jgi:DNA mismatch repair protein MutH